MIFLDADDLKNAKVTLGLILINIIFFFITYLDFPLENFLIFVQINRRIIENYEIWRIFTSLFLHANELHLFSNMISLLFFGATIETNPNISKLQFLLIYLISGIIGNLFSLVLLPYNAISLGASGAIFGLIGVVLIMIATENRTLLPFTLMYVGYFVISSLMPGINIWAHIFGLLGGIICGYIIYYRKKLKLYKY